MRVGVISDTHGLLRPEAIAHLQGVDAIVHAGDIGGQGILGALEAIAPVYAVRGNCDGAWASALPWTRLEVLGGAGFYVLHDLGGLDLAPEAAKVRVVVSGHTHRPAVRWQGPVLYLNPGSAGPRRMDLPIALALVDLEGEGIAPRIVTLG
jgi:putative phosphoesterase